MEVPYVLISLRESEERRRKALQQLRRWRNGNVMIVERSGRGSVHGVFESHAKALRHHLENSEGSKVVAVFEDDVEATKEEETLLETTIRQFEKSGADMCHLGCNEVHLALLPKGMVSRNLMDAKATSTHALLYRRESIPDILRILELELQKEETPHIDVFLRGCTEIRDVLACPLLYEQDREVKTTNVDWCKDMPAHCEFLRRKGHVAYFRTQDVLNRIRPLLTIASLCICILVTALLLKWICKKD